MARAYLVLGDRAAALDYPEALGETIIPMMGLELSAASGLRVTSEISIEQSRDGRFRVRSGNDLLAGDLGLGDAVNTGWRQAVMSVADGFPRPSVILHAASLERAGVAVLVPGQSGRGKSSLTAWLMKQGYRHLSDDVAALHADGCLSAIYGPLIIRGDVWPLVERLGLPGRHLDLDGGGRLVQSQSKADTPTMPLPCRLILMPAFSRSRPPVIELVSLARSATALMGQNHVALDTGDDGLQIALRVAREAVTLRLTYGRFEEIEGVLLPLIDQIVRSGSVGIEQGITEANKVLNDGRKASDAAASTTTQATATTAEAIPTATPRLYFRPRLTIGMATYDDYDGVYFTVQALRMYHAEVMAETEIIVIDNHPTGQAAPLLKKMEGEAKNFRYIPYTDKSGTAASREHLFAQASGDFVMCMDCHVFLVPNALKRLMEYFDAHPETGDLFQGPLLYDDHKTISTHWEPNWREGMFGTWETNKTAFDMDAPPFEIPSMGLGIFACRKAAWPHFNPHFRGFGGEEGYIHEKFRRAGNRAMCLPFLRWMHRFGRIGGAPYVNTWEDRIHNYYVGHRELGIDTAEMEAHFAKHLGSETFARIQAQLGFAPAKSLETT